MRKITSLILSVFLIFLSIETYAAVNNDFFTMQALALYSASQSDDCISVSGENIDVLDKTVTVSFSSDTLIENESDITIVAYKPNQEGGAPSVENIYYIDQRVYNDNSVSFVLPPNAPLGKYVILMGASDLSVVAKADFFVYPSGDFNKDFVFNTLDVIKLKKCISEGVPALSPGDEFIADYNKDGTVNMMDIGAMKSAIANRVY